MEEEFGASLSVRRTPHGTRCSASPPSRYLGLSRPSRTRQGKETADAASAARSTVTMDSFAAPPADAHLVYVIADAQ